MPTQSAKKRGAKPPDSSPSGAGVIFAGIGLLIVLSVGVFVLVRDDSATPGQPQPVMTLDPQIVINLTELPQATPLSGAEADTWNEFRAMVDACEAYSLERRLQMDQHIQWLLDPSDMPPDVILAMGSNPAERLVFGMAAYTSTQWRLDNRPPESCLVPIGRALNEMLVALGEPPFDLYDDAGPSS
jgi:hypothetical protein